VPLKTEKIKAIFKKIFDQTSEIKNAPDGKPKIGKFLKNVTFMIRLVLDFVKHT